MRCITLVCACVMLLGQVAGGAAKTPGETPEVADAADRLRRVEADGRIVVTPPAVPAELVNPWPEAWEADFVDRCNQVLAAQAALPLRVNTYFENEKRGYGHAMAQLLVDATRPAALKALQAEDAQAGSWHKQTAGIDFYAAFTLKHQVRKYFHFGPFLDEAYRQRMYDGARSWTERDPLRRPHHAFERKSGWGPDAKNSWVDVRTTDNLHLMRITSVYLFAEETGNDATADAYRRQIETYVTGLHRIAMSEWDSENYLGHSLVPLHNLYDFARDEQVRATAKAGLDWLYTTAALKYFRGGFNGPSKRDYNHVQPFGGSAATMLWLYFGDTPAPPEHFEYDEVHLITSAYRPPAAAVRLARKQLPLPAEVWAAKPPYGATQEGRHDVPPAYLETQYLGRTFQLGSLAEGTSTDGGDVNGFKLMMRSAARGVADVQLAPTADPFSVGSPLYRKGVIGSPNRVGQWRNAAVWLAKGPTPWTLVTPRQVTVEVVDGVTFLRGDETWLALRPLGVGPLTPDEEQTAAIAYRRNKDGSVRQDRQGNPEPRWPDHQVLSTPAGEAVFSGMAIEVGEAPEHAGYEAFRDAVLSRGGLDASGLAQGDVTLRTADGRRLRVRYAQDARQLLVERDGKPHDWQQHAACAYQQPGTPAEAAVLHQRWGGGTLRAQAGEAELVSTLPADVAGEPKQP